jgi:hypothetical protein
LALGLFSIFSTAQVVVCVLTVSSFHWPSIQGGLFIGGAMAVTVAVVVATRRELQVSASAQANHIYVSTQRKLNRDGSLTVLASVHNRSDEPIWGVEMVPRRDGQPYDAEASQTLPDVMPSMIEEWQWSVSSENAAHEERYPELCFLDSRMRRWRRIGPGLELQGSPR